MSGSRTNGSTRASYSTRGRRVNLPGRMNAGVLVLHPNERPFLRGLAARLTAAGDFRWSPDGTAHAGSRRAQHRTPIAARPHRPHGGGPKDAAVLSPLGQRARNFAGSNAPSQDLAPS